MSARTDARRGFVDAAIALALGGLYVALLLRTVGDLGYARDEGFYFQAAQSYARWFDQLWHAPKAALDPRAIDAAWSMNHEHPGLVKSLFALSSLVLQGKLHLFAMEGTSYRFPAMALAGAGVGLVYLWGARAEGRVAGLGAAVLLAAMPRVFFHAHLACFDVPITTFFTLTAYAYWRTLSSRGVLWPLLTGVAFGLALDTKHNAWFLPFLLAAHAAVLAVRGRLLGGAPDDRAPGRRALAALASMAFVGPAVFYALWPWIWHDTLARLRGWASFHLNHEYYNMEFLGRNYWTAPMPRLYAPVMTVATVPTVTLLLFAAGLCAALRVELAGPVATLSTRLGLRRAGEALARLGGRGLSALPDREATGLLWLLGVLVSYAAWLSPSTPIFGGTKHWLTAYPFVALFAGIALSRAVLAARLEALRARHRIGPSLARAARGPAPAVLVASAVFAAPIAETLHAHPWGLSAYVPLVGGAPGGATLGLNRGFWGYATGAVAPYLNAAVPRGGTVYIHDTAGASWDMLLKDGRLRRDIRGVWSIDGADFGLYHHERHMQGQEQQAWVSFGTVRPDHAGGLDGVPVILVYRRPK
jgi:4-amino-4-deoxy-L-arabinose transferase-like glycosyltransferase